MKEFNATRKVQRLLLSRAYYRMLNKESISPIKMLQRKQRSLHHEQHERAHILTMVNLWRVRKIACTTRSHLTPAPVQVNMGAFR